MTTNAAPPFSPRAAPFRGLLTALLLVAFLLATTAVCVAAIQFALPREPALSAGLVADYAWETPEYVPLQTKLAVFLVREGDTILAVDATSPTSGCRIGWLDDGAIYRDPCCGFTWERDGSPARGPHAGPVSLTRYQVEVNEAGEIIVLPWRDDIGGVADLC